MRSAEKISLRLHFRFFLRRGSAFLLAAAIRAWDKRDTVVFDSFTGEGVWVLALRIAGYLTAGEGLAGAALTLCDDVQAHFRGNDKE